MMEILFLPAKLETVKRELSRNSTLPDSLVEIEMDDVDEVEL